MAENIEADDPEKDLVLIDSKSGDTLLLDYDLNDVVLASPETQDVVIFENLPRDFVTYVNPPDNVVAVAPQVSNELIVSALVGPKGDRGPKGDTGPEGKHVVDVVLEGSELVTTLSDGSQINAGEIPVGSGESPSLTFEFLNATDLWVCEHNFDRRAVQVVTYDISGREMLGDVSYLSNNLVQIQWYFPTSGTAQITK